eukprot:Gb_30027 [translate_table: standard]
MIPPLRNGFHRLFTVSYILFPRSGWAFSQNLCTPRGSNEWLSPSFCGAIHIQVYSSNPVTCTSKSFSTGGWRCFFPSFFLRRGWHSPSRLRPLAPAWISCARHVSPCLPVTTFSVDASLLEQRSTHKQAWSPPARMMHLSLSVLLHELVVLQLELFCEVTLGLGHSKIIDQSIEYCGGNSACGLAQCDGVTQIVAMSML